MTTISFFKYKTNKYWAFKQMRLAYDVIKNSQGVIFFKLLGTGAGDGFSLFPDFSTYSILCVWEKEVDAVNFINNSELEKYKLEEIKLKKRKIKLLQEANYYSEEIRRIRDWKTFDICCYYYNCSKERVR